MKVHRQVARRAAGWGSTGNQAKSYPGEDRQDLNLNLVTGSNRLLRFSDKGLPFQHDKNSILAKLSTDSCQNDFTDSEGNSSN